jgi:hypothetical protein
MSARRHRVAWFPPLLVGASAAVVAEVAVAILLYSGPGMIRSLTTVLAVEGGALAVGLWSAPGPGMGLVDRLRRRWLLCLFAVLVAALYGTFWSVLEGIGSERIGQALGLAALAALPLYACGTVLGGMTSEARSDPSGSRRGPGAAAALGAGLGFVLTGFLLPRAPLPSSLLVGCLIMLSLAGMVYGSVLESLVQIHRVASRPGVAGAVRIEDRRLPGERAFSRLLVEGARVRRSISLDPDGLIPWDVALVRASMPASESAWRILYVGGGASGAAATVVAEHPAASVEVLERFGGVVELARDHLGTGLSEDAAGRLTVKIGNLDDLLEDAVGFYDLVIVDLGAVSTAGGHPGLSRRSRSTLHRLLGETGLMAWGGGGVLEPGQLSGEGYHRVFYREVRGGRESLVLMRPLEGLPWPADLDGFQPYSRASSDA